MTMFEEAINRHYGRPGLTERIMAALAERGLNANTLTREDLSSFDQLHSGGLSATRWLAELAGLSDSPRGRTALDVGCGIGGPPGPWRRSTDLVSPASSSAKSS